MGNWVLGREGKLSKETMTVQEPRPRPRFPDSDLMFFILYKQKCQEIIIITSTAASSAHVEEWREAAGCAWEPCSEIYTTAKQTCHWVRAADLSVLHFQRQGHLPWVFHCSRQDIELCDTCLPVSCTYIPNTMWFVVVVACLQNLTLKVVVSPKPLLKKNSLFMLQLPMGDLPCCCHFQVIKLDIFIELRRYIHNISQEICWEMVPTPLCLCLIKL